MKNYLCLGFSLAALLSGHAQSQGLNTIQPTLNAECVDTAPVGDGFGWNGRCGCDVEPEWTGFGTGVALSKNMSNNIAAISAVDTPENCPGGDSTVSIYEKDDSGSWSKSTEFPTAHYRDLVFVDNMLIVGSTVYEKQDNGEWLEQQITTATGEYFKATDGFPGTYVTGFNSFSTAGGAPRTLSFSTRDEYGNETGRSLVTTDLGDYFYDVSVSGDIAFAKYFYSGLGSPPNGFALLSRDTTGNWQIDERVPVEPRDREIALKIIGESVVSTGIELVTWTRNATGEWQQEVDSFPTSLPTYHSYFEPGSYLNGRRLLLTMPYAFGVYTLDNNDRWSEGDLFELPVEVPRSVWTGDQSGEATRGNIAFGGDNILVGSARENLVYALGVSAEGTISATTVTNQISSSSCDYSNATSYDGWGWNPGTQMSCPPLEVITPINNCDYSNATQFGGWGWNPVAQTSCAPNETTAVTEPANNNAQCDYSNAAIYNGWGWNATLGESCPPQAELTTPSNNCVDDDNDGWGWNGTNSCRVVAVQCFDPDGDGWGWDGTSSCRV